MGVTVDNNVEDVKGQRYRNEKRKQTQTQRTVVGGARRARSVWDNWSDWADGSILLSTAKAGEEDEGGFDEAGAWVSWIAFEGGLAKNSASSSG